jgi:hypothetical protein
MVLQSCQQLQLRLPFFSPIRTDPDRTQTGFSATQRAQQVSNSPQNLPPLQPNSRHLSKPRPCIFHTQRQKVPFLRSRACRQRQVRCLIASDDRFAEYYKSALTSPIISVVIPVFNEVESISLVLEKVASALQRRGFTYEILCVDDGSTDGKSSTTSSTPFC